MKSKRFISVVLATLFTLGLVGCGSSNSKEEGKTSGNTAQEEKSQIKDGGTMVFAASTDPTSLNPLYQQNRVTFTVNNALFSPLFVVEKDETRYYLAESMKVSEDKLTYTVKLKDNLKWHDGKKITADDIIYTVGVIQDEKNAIGDRESFVVDGKNIETKKVDDLTVEFKLPQVFAPFDANLGSLKPIPKHIFEGEENLAKSEKNNTPVGSGPFKFKEWQKGEALTLERFDEYFGGKPHLENVVFRIIPDSNTAKIAFENGEVSATYLTEENFNKLSSNDKFDTYAFDEGMLNYLIMNEGHNKELAKPEVRQAISYALNKDEILAAKYTDMNNTKKAYSILAPSTKYFTEDVEKYEHNKDKAKELLSKVGVSDLKINFQYVGGKDDNLAAIVQKQLADVGITVELRSIDQNTFFDKLLGETERDYDLIANGYVMGVDPNSYASAYESDGSFNAMQYKNPETDKLWKEGAKEADDTKRKEIYENIQKQLAEQAVIYPLDYNKSLVGINAKFGGVEEAKLVPIYMFEDLSKIYMKE